MACGQSRNIHEPILGTDTSLLALLGTCGPVPIAPRNYCYGYTLTKCSSPEFVPMALGPPATSMKGGIVGGQQIDAVRSCVSAFEVRGRTHHHAHVRPDPHRHCP